MIVPPRMKLALMPYMRSCKVQHTALNCPHYNMSVRVNQTLGEVELPPDVAPEVTMGINPKGPMKLHQRQLQSFSS